MSNKIEELQKKQQGYEAALAAVNYSKPNSTGIQKHDDDENQASVIFNPENNRFRIDVFDHRTQNRNYLTDLSIPCAKLIMKALNEFFAEEANAD